MDVRFRPLHPDRSAVLFIYAGQHLDQCGFSGTIFSHQRMDFAPAQGKVHIVQCPCARKNLVDIAHG